MLVRAGGVFVASFFPALTPPDGLTFEEAAAACQKAADACNMYEAHRQLVRAAQMSLATGQANILEEALIEVNRVAEESGVKLQEPP